MTDPTTPPARVTQPDWLARIARGCGYTCPGLDQISGTCELHGPTEADLIIQRLREGFASDVRRILGERHVGR